VTQAAAAGYRALAITDRNSLAGMVRAHLAARSIGLKLIVGAEITLQDAPPVVLWAPSRRAYANLCRLITLGRLRAEKGNCLLYLDDLARHSEELIAGLIVGDAQGWASAPQRPQGRVTKPRLQPWAHWVGTYRDLFPGRCYLLAERHLHGEDRQDVQWLVKLSRWAKIAPVASNDVYYHHPQRRFLQDVLTAIRLGLPVQEAKAHFLPNGEHYLKSPRQMAQLWKDWPEALRHTEEVVERCTFSLEELRYEYPEELSPPGQTPMEYLRRLVWEQAQQRYPRGIPEKVRRLLQHELALIEELKYEAYFLTVWDLVQFARSCQILCQGRGSAANSAVCYCLGITSVDPDRIDTLFERFISRERNEPPDIDVDFEHHRREEVLQYLYRKYGRERAGLAAAVITYQIRSAVRDVGKALGWSRDQVEHLVRTLDPTDEPSQLPGRLQEAGWDPTTREARRFLWLVHELIGFPRHLSQHVGGMVITRGPLCELVPIENAAMPGRTVIQWDKDDLEELGILKVDCLALGMLTAIHQCFELIQRHHGQTLTLSTIPPEDSHVYEMISRADTMGVFQIESRAQMSMLPRLRPQCFYDLVIEVAIVRPGPIQGHMVHPYLRRRQGLEPVWYPNDEIRQVLEKTLGVPLFQEQAMRLAMVAAGFTPGEADQLRRAMGAWRRPGLIEQFRQKLIEGMKTRGLSEEYAEQVFRQIRGFGEYGFPESHAASFALLVYVSAWLKYYYPAAFLAALLNSQPMGFYAPAQLIQDARRHGVEVRPVDVNASHWECTLEGPEESALAGSPAVRLGFCLVKGLSRETGERLVAERARRGPFASVADLAQRTSLSQACLNRLARADAFQSLGLSRRQALWEALAAAERRPLLQSLTSQPIDLAVPEAPLGQELLEDYRQMGLSLRAHPLQELRASLDRRAVVKAAELKDLAAGQWVRVAGLVLVRQRPSTAKGITFVTLEDETGMVNLVVRPEVWQRYRKAAHLAVLLQAEGPLDRQGEVIHVLAQRLRDLSPLLADLRSQARNFQ
jgi:error-prone DNA polymerase